MEQLKRIRKMPVSALMVKDVVIIDRNETVAKSIQLMKSHKTTSIIVNPRDDGDTFGIITERDILEKVIDPGSDVYRDPWNTPVSDIMSKPLISIYPDMPLKYALRLMKRSNIRHIAVMEGKKLMGILSEAEVLNHVEETLSPEGGQRAF